MKAVYLRITSWAGVSIGAEHFYGSLTCNSPHSKVEVSKPMSQEEVDTLNKKDNWDSYKVGDLTERFDTEDDVRQRAIEILKVHFPDCELLFEGSSCCSDPCKVVIAPEPMFTEGNRLYAAAKKIGFWDNDEKAMHKLADEWDKLFPDAI